MKTKHRRRWRHDPWPDRFEAFAILFPCVVLILALAFWPAVLSPPVQQDPPVEEPMQIQSRVEPRVVYPHSVVPGGVHTGTELADAMHRDPVARAHYAGFRHEWATVVQAQLPSVYVSYRTGEQIYWTGKPVRIPAGEGLLSDGVNLVRERCGNRISLVPMQPVAAHEPPAAELDIPEVIPTTDVSLNVYPLPLLVPEIFPPFPLGVLPGSAVLPPTDAWPYEQMPGGSPPLNLGGSPPPGFYWPVPPPYVITPPAGPPGSVPTPTAPPVVPPVYPPYLPPAPPYPPWLPPGPPQPPWFPPGPPSPPGPPMPPGPPELPPCCVLPPLPPCCAPPEPPPCCVWPPIEPPLPPIPPIPPPGPPPGPPPTITPEPAGLKVLVGAFIVLLLILNHDRKKP